jgi:Tfp pilus assembly protein PilV
MYNSLCNKRGISMVEVLVSMVLVIIGVLGLLTMLPNSWRLSGRSDLLGKASGVLMNQLHVNEARILNPGAAVTAGTTSATVNASGQGAALPGDTAFTVQTTLTDLGGGTAWMVRVQVTWQGNATGISESMRVVRQQSFTQ